VTSSTHTDPAAKTSLSTTDASKFNVAPPGRSAFGTVAVIFVQFAPRVCALVRGCIGLYRVISVVPSGVFGRTACVVHSPTVTSRLIPEGKLRAQSSTAYSVSLSTLMPFRFVVWPGTPNAIGSAEGSQILPAPQHTVGYRNVNQSVSVRDGSVQSGLQSQQRQGTSNQWVTFYPHRSGGRCVASRCRRRMRHEHHTRQRLPATGPSSLSYQNTQHAFSAEKRRGSCDWTLARRHSI
jgi:hypothetical protein